MKNSSPCFGINLWIVTLVLVASATAFAQVPCATLKDCQDLKTSLEVQLKEVDAQIMTMVIQPIDWPNFWKSADGTIWSDRLPKKYPNCISKKDGNGEPILKDGFAECEMDPSGKKYIGTSTNGLKVIDSDAIRACQAIGGNLPSQGNFKKLGSDYKRLPNISGNLFASTTIDSESPSGLSFGLDGDTGNTDFKSVASRNYLWSVRCIGR